MATLDRTRPYGESIGDPSHKYVQDNKLFNEQGEEINPAGNERDELIAQLEALGVEYDKRWGIPKLQEALEQG